MPKHQRVVVEIDIPSGPETPDKGRYLRVPEPAIDQDLMIEIRELESEGTPVFPENPTQTQIHLVGTPSALEELGKYLIALARLPTIDPESYGSFDEVRNFEGGTIRLIPRRVATLPSTPDGPATS